MKATIRGSIESSPLLKKLLRPVYHVFRRGRSVSHGYTQLTEDIREAEASKLRSSWLDETIPLLQRSLVDEQLANFRAGGSVDVFDILTESLRKIAQGSKKLSLLEIGCSSGYYSEVFEIAGLDVEYSGCDYSPAFIAMAKSIYPDRQFEVADATALPHASRAFDIAVSGCCLLHIPEYKRAIEETARVTRSFAVFHRTPVVIGGDTRYFTKTVYNIKTIEIHFSEVEFYELLKKSSLKVIDVHTITEDVSAGRGSAMRTYICTKLS